MKQRIVTAFVEFKKEGSSGLDSLTTQFESNGYTVKQIVSSAIETAHTSNGFSSPKLAITLLLEKD